MRVAAYIRVSSKRQALDRWSLPAQREAIARHCAQRDWPEPTWYVEAHTAKSDDPDARPIFRRLMDDAHARRFDTLIIVEVDRFARSVVAGLTAAARFERAGVQVVSLYDGDISTEDPDSEFTFTLKLMLARRENRIRSRKTTMGMTYRQAQGLWNGTVPWGARMDGAGRLVVDGEKADLLDWALRTMAREPFSGVAAEFNRRGERTARGNLWRPFSVEQWLAHADWLGRMPAPWPALLDAARGRRRAVRTPRHRRSHMLTGLLRCVCGGRIGASGTWVRPDGVRSQSMRCLHWTPERPSGAGCARRLAEMAHYEALMTAWVVALPDLAGLRSAREADSDAALFAARADIEERRRLLGIALADRAMDLVNYRLRLAALVREEAALPPPSLALAAFGAGIKLVQEHWFDDDYRGDPQNAGLRLLVDHCLVDGRDMTVVPVPDLAGYLGNRASA